MSLAGRAYAQGSRLTIRRATGGRAADGSGLTESWTTIASGVAASLQPLNADLALKVFGPESVATVRAMIPATDAFSLQVGDLVMVTSGDNSGARYRISDGLTQYWRRYWDAPLESTEETGT